MQAPPREQMFRKYAKVIIKAKIALLVCDEGHRLKNSVGNKTIAALSTCQTKRRLILTGTPVQNDLQEFYAMASFVNPTVLGTLSTFKRVFQIPIEKGGWLAGCGVLLCGARELTHSLACRVVSPGRDRSASPADQQLGTQRSKEVTVIESHTHTRLALASSLLVATCSSLLP